MVDNTISNESLAMMDFENNKKSEGVAFLLWFFLGLFGAHRFYLKQVASAVVMLILTLTFVGIFVTAIWWVIDAFLITGMVREHNQTLINKIKNEDTVDKDKKQNIFVYIFLFVAGFLFGGF